MKINKLEEYKFDSNRIVHRDNIVIVKVEDLISYSNQQTLAINLLIDIVNNQFDHIKSIEETFKNVKFKNEGARGSSGGNGGGGGGLLF